MDPHMAVAGFAFLSAVAMLFAIVLYVFSAMAVGVQPVDLGTTFPVLDSFDDVGGPELSLSFFGASLLAAAAGFVFAWLAIAHALGTVSL